MTRSEPSLASPGVMLFAAAIFALVGYFTHFLPPGGAPTVDIVLCVLLTWTLRVGAIVFAVAGVLTMVRPLGGNLLYALVSLAAGAAFLTAGVLDFMNPAYPALLHPAVWVVFGLWDGYEGVTTLRAVLAVRRHSPDAGPLSG